MLYIRVKKKGVEMVFVHSLHECIYCGRRFIYDDKYVETACYYCNKTQKEQEKNKSTILDYWLRLKGIK